MPGRLLVQCGVRPVQHRPLQGGEFPQPLPAHVGLWLDRMLDEPFDPGVSGWPGRTYLYQVAEEALRAEQPAVSSYRRVFERWKAAFGSAGPGLYRRTVQLEAKSRVLLHPAAGESVTEGAILLHHTYGVPYLPGSALKGIARARLEHLAKRKGSSVPVGLADTLLGRVRQDSKGNEEGQASFLEFLDALWIPERPANRPTWTGPLALDVVTPHHSDYYTTSNDSRPWPTDGDNPIPVQRLTVAPGTLFLLVVESAPDLTRWADYVLDQALLPALEQDGIGAATGAGYGRTKALSGNGHGPTPASGSGHRPWSLRTVEWDPGRRVLQTDAERGARATADEATSKALLDGLGETLRARLLGRRREAKVEVQLAREGSTWRIVGLRDPVENSERP